MATKATKKTSAASKPKVNAAKAKPADAKKSTKTETSNAARTAAVKRAETTALLREGIAVIPHADVATDFAGKHLSGFIDFLREQSVVGLAIGLVMGTQIKALVDSLIGSFINPIVGLLLPGRGSLDQKIFTVDINGKRGVFQWGSFVATLISFIIVAAVVYSLFKVLKLDRLTKKKDDKSHR